MILWGAYFWQCFIIPLHLPELAGWLGRQKRDPFMGIEALQTLQLFMLRDV